MGSLKSSIKILLWCSIPVFSILGQADRTGANDKPNFELLFKQCGGEVAPETLKAIIAVESGGNPNAINVNISEGQGKPKFVAPSSYKEAVSTAKFLINSGYNIDMGLMQINSSNLPRLKLTPDEIFEPCSNIKAGSKILLGAYEGAKKALGDGQESLKAALSAYNTGNYEKDFHNGYVSKYYGEAPPEYKVPAIESNKSFDPAQAKPRPAQGPAWGKKDTIFDASMAVDLELEKHKEQETVLVNEDNPYTASMNAWPTPGPEKGEIEMSEDKKTVYPMTSNNLADLEKKGVIVTVSQEDAEKYGFEDESVPIEDVLDAVND